MINLYMNISENSRVWIYQSDRAFTSSEEESIKGALDEFTGQWQAHGNQLTAASEIRYNRFIILIVDESQAGASGCSIDKSVNLMKEIEKHFNVNLFDRFIIAYKDGNQVLSTNREGFEDLIREGKVNEDTIVFNNLVPTVSDLNSKWEVPFKDSWHATVFGSLIE
jgi:hypothetical protein